MFSNNVNLDDIKKFDNNCCAFTREDNGLERR